MSAPPVEIPLETVGVPGAPEPLVQEITFDDEPEAPAQPAAPQAEPVQQAPAAQAPAAQEGRRFPEDPMPKRSPREAHRLERRRAFAQARGGPCAYCVRAACGPRGDPAWKQLLDNAVKDAPHPEEATRVFEPVAPGAAAPACRARAARGTGGPAQDALSQLAAPQPRQGGSAVELTALCCSILTSRTPVLTPRRSRRPRLPSPSRPRCSRSLRPCSP